MTPKIKKEKVEFRISPELYRELEPCLRRPRELSSVCRRFVLEGARRERFPGIDFRSAGNRSVAYLAGSRWPVWMILGLVEELDGDIEAAAAQMRRPPALVRLALRYASAYPAEMRAERNLVNQRGDYAGMKSLLPELEEA
jgi:hypothetical protein